MRWRDALLGTLGAVLTVGSAAVVFLPDLVRRVGPADAVVRPLSAVDATALMFVATLVAGLYVAAIARSPGGESGLEPVSDAERRYERATIHPPEAVTADRRQLTAAGLDADVDAAIEAGGDRLADLRGTLRRTALAVYVESERVDRATGKEAIAAGTWTADPTAAAFLADGDGPRPAILSRVRLWLSPASERRRRVDRTLTAIEDVAEGHR